MTNRHAFRNRDKVELFDLMLSDPRVKAGQGFNVSFGEVYLDAIHRSLVRVLTDDSESSQLPQSTGA